MTGRSRPTTDVQKKFCRRVRLNAWLLTGPWFSLHMEAFLVYTSLHEAAEDRWSNAASRYVGDDSALGGASGGSRRESEQCDEELRAVPYHDLSLVAGGETRRRKSIAGAPAPGAATEAHPCAEVEGAALDQWQGSAPVRVRLWPLDA